MEIVRVSFFFFSPKDKERERRSYFFQVTRKFRRGKKNKMLERMRFLHLHSGFLHLFQEVYSSSFFSVVWWLASTAINGLKPISKYSTALLSLTITLPLSLINQQIIFLSFHRGGGGVERISVTPISTVYVVVVVVVVVSGERAILFGVRIMRR